MKVTHINRVCYPDQGREPLVELLIAVVERARKDARLRNPALAEPARRWLAELEQNAGKGGKREDFNPVR